MDCKTNGVVAARRPTKICTSFRVASEDQCISRRKSSASPIAANRAMKNIPKNIQSDADTAVYPSSEHVVVLVSLSAHGAHPAFVQNSGRAHCVALISKFSKSRQNTKSNSAHQQSKPYIVVNHFSRADLAVSIVTVPYLVPVIISASKLHIPPSYPHFPHNFHKFKKSRKNKKNFSPIHKNRHLGYLLHNFTLRAHTPAST